MRTFIVTGLDIVQMTPYAEEHAADDPQQAQYMFLSEHDNPHLVLTATIEVPAGVVLAIH